MKQAQIEELFPHAARNGLIRPIIGMEDPFHYRNKVVAPYVPARRSGKKRPSRAEGKCPRVLTGMYAPGTHDVIPTDACLLEHERAKAAVLAVRDLMERHGMQPYDEDKGTGFMRHAVARAGRTGELLLTLVTNGEEFPASRAFCRELVRRVPDVTTVVQSVNTRITNVILGEKERALYGPGFILDELCGLRFRISSASFYQVNAVQAEALYEAAVALTDAGPDDTVIDAYCGTGTIGLVAAARGAGRLIGVESVESAVSDARMNARHNGIAQADFICADATRWIEDCTERLAEDDHAPILLLDPPRSGTTPEFARAACAMGPKRIVYISCDPRTQARDIALLEEGGYEVRVVQPVDMFPHTHHIENIVLMVPRA